MIEHLSYSSINTFLTCGEHWRRKYRAGERTPSTPALVFGSAVHSTIEEHIRLATNAPKLTDIWPGMWAAKLAADEGNIDWGADNPAEHFNEGLRILGTPDVQRLAESITPLIDDTGPYIERKITLTVPGVPVPIIGYIDVMTADGVPGDFKTSVQQWSQDKAREELQPAFYLAALNQAGIKVPQLRFRHYVITKAKTPKVQVLEHQRTWDEIFWLFELIRGVWKAIEAESFTMNPNGWLCNPKYCQFWQICRGRGI